MKVFFLLSQKRVTQDKTIYDRYVFYRTQIAMSHIGVTVKRNKNKADT